MAEGIGAPSPSPSAATVATIATANTPITPATIGKIPTIERNSEEDGASAGKASGRGRKRAGLTAGGAGASQKELEEMPTARQKRILANRQSAARSKERKLAYISELEAQVSALTVQLTSASLQLRSLQQDTSSLGECNAALAQQALVLRDHMAQRDAETAALAAELRRAQGLLAAHNIQNTVPASTAPGEGGENGSVSANATTSQPPPSSSPHTTAAQPVSQSINGDVQQRPPVQQWTLAQAQQQQQQQQQQQEQQQQQQARVEMQHVSSSEVQAQLPVSKSTKEEATTGSAVQQPQHQQQVRDVQQQQPRSSDATGLVGQDTSGSQAAASNPYNGSQAMTTSETAGFSSGSMAAPASSASMQEMLSGVTDTSRAMPSAQQQTQGSGGANAIGRGNGNFSGYKASN